MSNNASPRHLSRRSVFACTVGLLAPFTIASVAHAAAPANDDIEGAIELSVPELIALDTTEATTSALETEINNTFCGAPALEHGVWFTATPAESGTFAIDVTGSDYAAGIFVAQGSPGALEPLLCGPGIVSGFAEAGTTYYVLVFGDGTGGPTSGNLVVETYVPPPPPVIDVTVDPTASVNRSGVVHLTGTVTCTSDDPQALLYEVDGEVTQKVGRFLIRGYFYTELFIPCDGVTQQWSADVAGDNGVFAGGKAASVVFAFGCGNLDCGSGYTEASIMLRRNGR